MTRKNPFSQTLLDVSTVSAIFWAVALFRVEYVGPVAVFIAASCGVLWLVAGVRRAFDAGSRDLADFVSGKQSPAKKEALQKERLEAVVAALDLAKFNKERFSKGLKQPNQSSTVRYINERISALLLEQLHLESALRRDVEAK